MKSIHKYKFLILSFLFFLEIVSVFLTFKSFNNKPIILDDVKFKEENKKEKKTVAIMLNEGDGSYKESTSTTFPKVGYIYNTQKSGCIDTTGKEVVNAINYESGKVSLRLNQKLYCYLYFDKKDAPIIDKFYINDETSNKTTKVPEVTIHLKWSDPYIKEHCITETPDIDSCMWQNTNGLTEITSNYTFTEQTSKTFYAYIKDVAEGVSEVKSDSIEYKVPITGASLVDKPISGVLESTGVAEDELAVRYYGTNPDNYICFGTNDKDICIDDIDKYMYRIIGVDKKGKFKLIKKEALNLTYKWHNTSLKDIKWNDSDLYKGLNGINGGAYSNLFIGNIEYMPDVWENKIEAVKWKYGDIRTYSIIASEILKIEQGWTTTVSAKIGLMYLADYYFAYQKSGLNCSSSSSTCKTSWMHISHTNWSSALERVISRYGQNNSRYSALAITSDGRIGADNLDTPRSVRPVFYLIPSIEISGSGTQTDPYIIVN